MLQESRAHLFAQISSTWTRPAVRTVVPARKGSFLCHDTRRSCVCGVTVGVDLGTSNCAVAAVVDGKPTVIPLQSGHLTMPSVVAYTRMNEPPRVGYDAKLVSPCPGVIYEAKRLIGRKFIDVQEEEKRMAYHITSNSDGMAQISVPEIDLDVSPELVSSHILKVLVNDAEAYLGEEVDKVVITIPAFFDTSQKAATITAAGLAGIHEVALIQEPIAAALAYGFGRPEDQDTILVLDLGGGTYDVSILESFEGMLEVISTAGDCFLGGSDFTMAIADWAAGQCLLVTNEDPRQNTKLLQELLESSEQAKLDIVRRSQGNVELQSGCGKQSFPLTSSTFEELTIHLTGRLWTPLEQAGADGKITWRQRLNISSQGEPPHSKEPQVSDPYAPPPRHITKVVLAGGASQLPVVKSLVSRVTGIANLESPVDPKLCVAFGASAFGAMMEGDIGTMELMDGSYASGMHGRVSGFSTSL